MVEKGLREVRNPSEMLLSQNREENMSGIAIGVTVEGIRPLLIEVQDRLLSVHRLCSGRRLSAIA